MEFSYFPYGGSHLGNEIKIQGGIMKGYLFGLGAMIVGSVVFWFFYATNYFPYIEPLG